MWLSGYTLLIWRKHIYITTYILELCRRIVNFNVRFLWFLLAFHLLCRARSVLGPEYTITLYLKECAFVFLIYCTSNFITVVMEKILKSPRGNLIYQHLYFPSSLFVYGCMLKKQPHNLVIAYIYLFTQHWSPPWILYV